MPNQLRGLNPELTYYIAVGVGLAVNTSSFTMISGLFLIGRNGATTILCVALAGALCLFTAHCVGQLARRYPGSAGILTYLRKGVGEEASLLLTYVYLFFIVLAGGLESHLFGVVVSATIPGFPVGVATSIPFGVVLGINLLRIRVPRIFQVVTTGLLLAMLVVTACAAIARGRPALPSALGGVGHGVGVAFTGTAMATFLFVGFEWIAPLGFSRKSYERAVPRGMFAAVATSMVVNALWILGLALNLPPAQIAQDMVPQIALNTRIFGRVGATLALSLSAMTVLSTFNAGLTGGAQLIYSLAREGKLFASLKALNQHGAPQNAVLVLFLVTLSSSLLTQHLNLEIAAAVASSAIVCVTYAGLIFSWGRLVATSLSARLVAVLLTLFYVAIGVSSLFSEKDLGLAPLVILSVVSAAVAPAYVRFRIRVRHTV